MAAFEETGGESLDGTFRARERTGARTEAVCVPAKIVKVNDKTVNVVQLLDAIGYEDGERKDVSPLDYEDVKYGAIGGQGISIFIPPKVGMTGLMFVTDYDVADIEKGKVSQDTIRRRSSGYFMPILESKYIENIEIVNENGGKIILSKSGIDCIGGTSMVDAIKELNDIVKSCCGSSSPAADGLIKAE
jgi:hypothetical protein